MTTIDPHGTGANRSDGPRVWPTALAIGALSLLLGMVTLGRKAFWYDEAFNAHAVANSWQLVSDLIRDREMSQSAYLVVLKAWSSVAGIDEATLRLPSVVATASAAVATVFLGSRLFDRWTGALAGLLLATNDFVVQWSQQARTYAFATLAAVVATWLFVRLVDDDRWRISAAYSAVAVAGLYFHFYVGFVIAAQAVSLFVVPHRPRWSRLLAVGSAIAVVGLPALYFTATASRQQVEWIASPSPEVISRALTQNVGHNPILAALAIAGLVLLWMRRRAEGRFLPTLLGAWVVLPVCLGVLTSFAVQPILVPRYLVVITPAIALLGAAALAELRRRSVAAATVAIGATLLASTYWIQHWYARTPEDWRSAAAYLQAVARPTDDIVVSPPWAVLPLRFYAPTVVVDGRPNARRRYVVIRLDGGDTPDGAAARAVDTTRATRAGRRQFGERVVVDTWLVPAS